MSMVELVVGVVLLSWLIMSEVASGGAPIAKSGCQTQCGNVTIPYPFGIGAAGCFLDKWFEIICTRENTTPFLSRTKLEVIDISLQGTVRVRNPITFWNCNKETKQSPNLEGSPFVFSQKNMFTAVGCGAFGLIMTSSYVSTNIAGCMSICGKTGGKTGTSTSTSLKNHSCNGVNCCQTNIPLYLNAFNTSFYAVDAEKEKACKYAFLVDQEWFVSNLTNISAIEEMVSVPVVLEWELYHTAIDVFGTFVETNSSAYSHHRCYVDGVTSAYGCYKNSSCNTYFATSYSSPLFINHSRIQCRCGWGYEGNPYLVEGCKDIDECNEDDNSCRDSGICHNYVGGYGCYYPSRNKIGVKLILIIVVGSILGLLFLLSGSWWLYKIMKKRGSVGYFSGKKEIELEGTQKLIEASNVLVPLVSSQSQTSMT